MTPSNLAPQETLTSSNSESSVRAGNLSRYLLNWKKFVSNSFLLRIIEEGYKIQLNNSKFHLAHVITKPSKLKYPLLFKEIETHLASGAISIINPLESDIVSRVFIVPKNSSKNRMIIDLSRLNEQVNKVSFKMEDKEIIKSIIEYNDYMVSIDLKDAFFSIALHEDSKRLTCFEIDSIRYCYNVLPFGLTSSPRIFTKILKPVISYLRTSGIKITAYLDDIFICSYSYENIVQSLNKTSSLLKSLGFSINIKKSNFIPSHKITHLGYIWDSSSMTISLPEEKINKIKQLCLKCSSNNNTLRQLSSLLGLMVSAGNAFKYAPIFYRKFQFCLLDGIKSCDDWETSWPLTEEAISDLNWWSDSDLNSFCPVSLKEKSCDVSLFTDSSLKGWGASLSSGLITSGSWSRDDSSSHINFLELKAVELAILEFLPSLRGKKISIRSDNTSVIFYLNKMGGTRSKKLCVLTLDIWKILISNSIDCFASHIAGIDNGIADFFSRFSHHHEYYLNMDTFIEITKLIPFLLKIDLFASKNNRKLQSYVTLFDDANAFQIDAFSFDWPSNIYVFPPTPLISKALLKIFRDNVDSCLFITPAWNTLPMIPLLKKSLISEPIFIPNSHLLGCLPTRHPFHLVAWPISSSFARTEVFQTRLLTHSSRVSVQVLSSLIQGSGLDLLNGLMLEKIVPICLPI